MPLRFVTAIAPIECFSVRALTCELRAGAPQSTNRPMADYTKPPNPYAETTPLVTPTAPAPQPAYYAAPPPTYDQSVRPHITGAPSRYCSHSRRPQWCRHPFPSMRTATSKHRSLIKVERRTRPRWAIRLPRVMPLLSPTSTTCTTPSGRKMSSYGAAVRPLDLDWFIPC